MKTLRLFLLFILIVPQAYGQGKLNEVHPDQVIIYKLPEKSKIIPVGVTVTTSSGEDVVRKHQLAFNVEGICVTLSAAAGKADSNYLEWRQNGIVGMSTDLGLNTDHHFEEKSINNYDVLSMDGDLINSVGRYYFFSISKTKVAVVGGMIEYPKSDRIKARKVLDDLLASIYFDN